ncbi:hypothetical protein F2Q69_00021160 [Brassica cretica]|uniref:Uncharacterized protein n=1 Tax=Brassica cretica TaxID=69181 RepID=A0A8S9QIF6_BRACR|nr:hypothetical protein F2Q69_00021160 [Brassica cretica]
MGIDMVTKGVHNVIDFLSDDSPDMDVIGISDNFFSDINKPAAVNCIEGHGSNKKRDREQGVENECVWLGGAQYTQEPHRLCCCRLSSENILPSSEGDVGLAASSGPSVLGDKVDEECAAADPPEISDAQNNRKRCRLTEAARLGTSQAELKDGTTRAPIVRFLSCQRAMELKPS